MNNLPNKLLKNILGNVLPRQFPKKLGTAAASANLPNFVGIGLSQGIALPIFTGEGGV
jgi:hypothetical protein